jgi:RNA 2',3'-cyclic 3'-phosphodiesterase
MPSTLRTFIGIRIAATPAVSAVLRELASLGRGLKPSNADELHLTAKFLGDTPRAQLPAITRALAEVASGATAHRVRLLGLGAFPQIARPGVVWMGIEPPDELKRIALELDADLEPLGFAPEARPYHPHLTLARVKGSVPAGLSDFIMAGKNSDFGDALIDRLELFQSEPTSTGSRYTSLASAALKQV